MDDFPLDPALARDTLAVTRLPLSLVRLMDNRHFPWLVLVPARKDAREWIDLERTQRSSFHFGWSPRSDSHH